MIPIYRGIASFFLIMYFGSLYRHLRPASERSITRTYPCLCTWALSLTWYHIPPASSEFQTSSYSIAHSLAQDHSFISPDYEPRFKKLQPILHQHRPLRHLRIYRGTPLLTMSITVSLLSSGPPPPPGSPWPSSISAAMLLIVYRPYAQPRHHPSA